MSIEFLIKMEHLHTCRYVDDLFSKVLKHIEPKNVFESTCKDSLKLFLNKNCKNFVCESKNV
jgi:hypothetical protein